MIFRMVGVKFYTLRSVKALCSALMNSVCGMCSRSPVRHTQNTFLLLWDVLNFLQFNNKLVEFTIHKKQNTESNDKLIDVVLNAAIDFQPEHKKKPNRYNRFLHTVTAWLLKESAPKKGEFCLHLLTLMSFPTVGLFLFCETKYFEEYC